MLTGDIFSSFLLKSLTSNTGLVYEWSVSDSISESAWKGLVVIFRYSIEITSDAIWVSYLREDFKFLTPLLHLPGDPEGWAPASLRVWTLAVKEFLAPWAELEITQVRLICVLTSPSFVLSSLFWGCSCLLISKIISILCSCTAHLHLLLTSKYKRPRHSVLSLRSGSNLQNLEVLGSEKIWLQMCLCNTVWVRDTGSQIPEEEGQQTPGPTSLLLLFANNKHINKLYREWVHNDLFYTIFRF